MGLAHTSTKGPTRFPECFRRCSFAPVSRTAALPGGTSAIAVTAIRRGRGWGRRKGRPSAGTVGPRAGGER